MFFAIAALLVQPQVAPQLSFSLQRKIALIQPAISAWIERRSRQHRSQRGFHAARNGGCIGLSL